MTRADHNSGTERLAEVVELCGFADDDIIVNVQGDEPLIPPQIIRQVAENLARCDAGMATLAVPIHDAAEAFNPNAVKVVRDSQGMRSISLALPFLGSRALCCLAEPDRANVSASHRYLCLSRRFYPPLCELGAQPA